MSRLKLFLGLAILFSFCAGERNNFRFEVEGKTLIKGNITSRGVPIGHFQFFEGSGKLISEGDYFGGLKTGSWSYNLAGKKYEIEWKNFAFGGYEFSLPAMWNVENKDGFVVSAFTLTEDSLISSNFIIKEHDYRKAGAEDFEEYSKAYFGEVDRNDLIERKVDYSEYYAKSFGNPNLTFYHYAGLDSSGDRISVFSTLVYNEDNDMVLELSYLCPFRNGEYSYRIFSDILLDVQYQASPLIPKWGLDW